MISRARACAHVCVRRERAALKLEAGVANCWVPEADPNKGMVWLLIDSLAGRTALCPKIHPLAFQPEDTVVFRQAEATALRSPHHFAIIEFTSVQQ
jgi:hypothetical protein